MNIVPRPYHYTLSDEALRETALWKENDVHEIPTWPKANEAVSILIERSTPENEEWLRSNFDELRSWDWSQDLVIEYAGKRASESDEWHACLRKWVQLPLDRRIRGNALIHLAENQRNPFSESEAIFRALESGKTNFLYQLARRLNEFAKPADDFWEILTSIAHQKESFLDTVYESVPIGNMPGIQDTALVAIGSLFRNQVRAKSFLKNVVVQSSAMCTLRDAFTGLAMSELDDEDIAWVEDQAIRLREGNLSAALNPMAEAFPANRIVRDTVFHGALFYCDWSTYQTASIDTLVKAYPDDPEALPTLKRLVADSDRSEEVVEAHLPVMLPCVRSFAAETLARYAPTPDTFTFLLEHTDEEYFDLRETIAESLIDYFPEHPETIPELERMFADTSEETRNNFSVAVGMRVAKEGQSRPEFADFAFSLAGRAGHIYEWAMFGVGIYLLDDPRTKDFLISAALNSDFSKVRRYFAVKDLVSGYPGIAEARQEIYALLEERGFSFNDGLASMLIAVPMEAETLRQYFLTLIERDPEKYKETTSALARNFRSPETYGFLKTLFEKAEHPSSRKFLGIELARGYSEYPETSAMLREYLEPYGSLPETDMELLRPSVLIPLFDEAWRNYED